MADNTEKLVTLSNLSDHIEEIKRILKQVRAYIDKQDSAKVDKVSGKQLSTNDYTTTEKNKLAGIESGAQKNTVTGIKGNAESSYRTGNVNLTPANIGAAAASHTHAISNITNLQTTLDGKAASSHTHAISDVNNLQTTLDGKAAKSHTHSANDITSGTLSIDRIADKSITKEKLADSIFTDDILISTIYIDQTITDPASMISGDINGVAIQAIRANSHRYLGKYTAENTMTICQLLDANSKLFHDGTVADLTGIEGDVWMLLPYFYTKATELAEDIWKIQFAFGGQPDGDGWMQWGGNDLIGVYEGYVTDSKLYSRSGVLPSADINQANFKTYARNRGTGFTLVKHKHQNIMAFLFYALYGNTNAQAICGSGTPDYSKTTGKTNSLGMNDTTASNGNSMSINYFGLENWWGNFYEWEDNIIVNSNVWNITEDDGTTRQVIGFYGNDIFFPTKLIIGDYLDTIMKPGSTNGSTSIGYCDGQYLTTDNNRIARRSFDSNNERGGLIFVSIQFDAYNTYGNRSSRLAFNGTIIEQKDVSTFKSLTAIG